MMKSLKLFLLGFAIVCFGAIAAHALTADFDILDDSIVIGENFDIEVSVNGDPSWGDLTGFGFVVRDDLLTNIVYDGYSLGADYINNLLETSGTDSHVNGMYSPIDPFATNAGQDVLLATLSFSAIGTGLETLTVDGSFVEPYFTGLFYLDWSNGVEVNEGFYESMSINVNPVPEPSTFILLGFCLAGLVGIKKKHS